MAGRAARRKGEDAAKAAVHRCDPLPHAMNRGKETRLRDLLRGWRDCGATVARLQWRLFHGEGRFDDTADPAKTFRKSYAKPRAAILESLTAQYGLDRPLPPEEGQRPPKLLLPTPPGLVDPLAVHKAAIGAAPVAMVRRQVVGMLKSFVSNRQNDFVDIVMGSTLDDLSRHMLLAVNKAKAWQALDRPIHAKRDDGRRILVTREMRLLARAIWRQVMSRHRKPSTRRIGASVDKRVATLLPARKNGKFKLWLRLVMPRHGTVEVPLHETERLREREGKRCSTFNISEDRHTGELRFGVVTDISGTCEVTKAAYVKTAKTETLALDFGLSTLFASDLGDLFGRGFIRKLKAIDLTVDGIARHFQRTNPGRKLRESRRYCRQVDRLRGYIETEVNSALNRAVAARLPRELVLERLDFRSPELSARMNRLVQNCGRRVVADKLRSLEQELGIASTQVRAAYTSQTCNACCYVDARNRRSQSQFVCLWCGHTTHADVNAARNARGRRSSPTEGAGSAGGRRAVLDGLVRRHVERWPNERVQRPLGLNGSLRRPADPRADNPYFRGRLAARSPAQCGSPAENRIGQGRGLSSSTPKSG